MLPDPPNPSFWRQSGSTSDADCRQNEGGTGTVSWGELWAETTGRLRMADHVEHAELEARWICEEASGFEGGEWVLGLQELATVGGVSRLDAMVARRMVGEPIQYVVGHWAFRTLDLMVDQRVLIPRPETEVVVGEALAELDRLLAARPAGQRPTVVDLGTGSGAIALSIAAERPRCDVWGVDRSADALAVARANLASLGMGGARVQLVEGSWWSALPAELAGSVALAVSNPPYVAASEPLDASVREWEPVGALVPGPSGLEAFTDIFGEASHWLAPDGVVVVEIGATQAEAVSAIARSGGLGQVRVARDLAGMDRAVVARR
jgi:release factor glutamine methyltransferase